MAAWVALAACSDEAGALKDPVDASSAACLERAAQLAIMGDSFIAKDVVALGDEGLAGRLAQRAREAGALSGGGGYRDYSSAGKTLSDVPQYADAAIARQWAAAKAAGEVRVVVMNGGGNDILGSSAITTPPVSCADPATEELSACYALLDAAIEDGRALFEDMRASGVLELIYIAYPNVLSSDNGRVVLSHLTAGMSELCESSTRDGFRCRVADLRPSFEGQPAYIGSDMIHPSAIGSERIADVVWEAIPPHCAR